jgi:hypothetical protein
MGKGRAHYYYCPFKGHSDTAIKATENTVVNKYGPRQPGGVRFDPSRDMNDWVDWIVVKSGAIGTAKPLDAVPLNAVLCIDGHGSNSEHVLGAKYADGSVRKFGPNDIAQLMKHDGLKEGHVLVKLLTCYAAGVLNDNSTQLDECFAAVLAKALYKEGFHKIVVEGYPNATYATKASNVKYKGAKIDGSEFKAYYSGLDGGKISEQMVDMLMK